MIKQRQETSPEDWWNVEALYPSMQAWEEQFKQKFVDFSRIEAFKGTLNQGAQQVKKLLDTYFEIDRLLSKLYTYAHLRHDEDVANDLNKEPYLRISSKIYDFRQKSAWIEPEILHLSATTLTEYLQSPELKEYRIFLEKIIRMKPHTLSAEKEELCAMAGKPLETAQRAFGAFNNADLKFPSVVDKEGSVKELTHGKFSLYLRGQDRVLREGAFKTLHQSFYAYENTLGELLQGQVQGHLFDARARSYASCMESALFPHQIDPQVYIALIQAVRKNLGSLHEYMGVRKKALGYDELHLYDMHVPLAASVDMTIPYDEAVQKVIDSLAPLGKEYQTTLKKGLIEERWVDRYENRGKRSGAYSSGCYDSMPYILMNYQGTFSDMMTLTHEAGHSMHTYLSAKNQPYHYSHYPIFVAEVASTFHEELLFRYLLEQAKSEEERISLINQKIDDIRSTFFRQTMFAEFELKIHQFAEQDIPLTPSLLKSEYRKLNIDYFGPDVVIDEQIDIEWSRIPHFYYNFYVYQYATGISAALALVEKVLHHNGRENYLRFLSSGSSRYPLDLLEQAGVDMRKPDAVDAIIQRFDSLVEQLKKSLVKKCSDTVCHKDYS